jgi:hypothetical protein
MTETNGFEPLKDLDEDAFDDDDDDDPSLAFGYCLLCRRKEMELYGTVISGVPVIKGKVDKHQKACRLAGCKHPPFYRVPHVPRPNRSKGDGQDD